MAEIMEVELDIKDSDLNGKKKATVSFKLAFTPAEAGKSFKYAITLYGEDDNNNELLYNFFYQSLGKGGVLTRPVTTKNIIAQAGEQQIIDERDVLAQTLDEDPGGFKVEPGHGFPPVWWPNVDEVFAKVKLIEGTIIIDEKNSPVVSPGPFWEW